MLVDTMKRFRESMVLWKMAVSGSLLAITPQKVATTLLHSIPPKSIMMVIAPCSDAFFGVAARSP